MKYSGAEIIIRILEINGIGLIAGIPGGSNLPLYDALHKSTIRHILARHEQGAGFIAQGIARSTGKPGICFATSGPGAANLITAIADAKLDSIPIIAITGQVPRAYIGTDAFQEVDMYGMTIPITKHNFLVKEAKELVRIIPEAFHIALSGRPGPVLVDVPRDVQIEKATVSNWPDAFSGGKPSLIHLHDIRKAVALFQKSRLPLFYVGGGIRFGNAGKYIEEISSDGNIPIAATLMGLSTIDTAHPWYYGLVGMHGQRETNEMFRKADLIIALGARFGDRTTGDIEYFCPQAKIIHVDIDEAEIGKNQSVDLGICADSASFLRAFQKHCDIRKSRWPCRVRQFTLGANSSFERALQPRAIMQYIARCVGRNALITTDVGQHQMWTAQYYPFTPKNKFLTSGGLGTMGFGFPAAIGAALMHPKRKVICISGDGSFLMNMQELAVLSEENLDLKIIILKNNHLGLVRQQQNLFYNQRYIASQLQCSPDFAGIARGFGVLGYDLSCTENPEALLYDALKKKGPALVSIPISHEEAVLPMVIPGKSNLEMIGG